MRESYRLVKDAIKGGIIPATVTPLTPDLDVAEDDLYTHIDNLTSTATESRGHS